jgi:hypothetical protein
MAKDGMLHVRLTKKNGQLLYSKADGVLFKKFEKELDEGVAVDGFFEVLGDSYTLGQLAKVHKCIRVLASDTGESFETMKLLVKKRAGLIVSKEIDGEVLAVIKSFGDCSMEELGLAIEAAIEIGDHTGSNLR